MIVTNEIDYEWDVDNQFVCAGFTDRNKKSVKAMETSDKIIYYVTKHSKFMARGIKKIDYKFEYPNEAIELLTSLNTECSTYVSNRENCTSDCKNLNRWPVLKARNIRYQVLTFDRKDSL